MKKRSNRENLSAKVGRILIVLIALALTTSWAWAQPSTKGEPVKSYRLTWISAFPKTHSVTVGFQKGFVEKVTELSQGRLAFIHKGGPETVPFPDTGKAIQNKVVDMGFSAVGNYEQMAPGVGGAILREISFDEERKPDGAFDYLVSLCKPGGLRYLGRGLPCNDLSFFSIFSNKKIEKAEDFKGYRMGTTTSTALAAAAWGATAINLSGPSDYYTSMERGTTDGVCSTTAEQIVASGTYQVIKYSPQPGFFDGSLSVLMNLKVWDTLPQDLQQMILQTMARYEKYSADLHQSVIEKAYKKMSDSGVQVYKFSPEMGKWLRDQAYDATWSDQIKRFPNQAPKLRALLSPARK